MKKTFRFLTVSTTVCFIILTLTFPITVNALNITLLSSSRHIDVYAKAGNITDSRDGSCISNLGTCTLDLTASANNPPYEAFANANQTTSISLTQSSLDVSGHLWARGSSTGITGSASSSASSSISLSFFVDDLAQYVVTRNGISGTTSANLTMNGIPYPLQFGDAGSPWRGTMIAGIYTLNLSAYGGSSGNSYNDPGDFGFSFDVTVAEPTTMLLLGLGFMGLVGIRKRIINIHLSKN